MEDSGPSCLARCQDNAQNTTADPGSALPRLLLVSALSLGAAAVVVFLLFRADYPEIRAYYDVREKESKSWVDVFDGGRCRFDFIGSADGCMVYTKDWHFSEGQYVGPKADRTRTCSAARRVRSAVAPTGASARSARTSQISQRGCNEAAGSSRGGGAAACR